MMVDLNFDCDARGAPELMARRGRSPSMVKVEHLAGVAFLVDIAA